MNWFETVALAQDAGAGGSGWISIAMIVGLIAIFYFLLIRPQSKQRKAHQALVSSLNRGDEIVTASGIIGVITKVSDDYISVRVAKNVELTIQKQAVHASMPKGTVQNLDG